MHGCWAGAAACASFVDQACVALAPVTPAAHRAAGVLFKPRLDAATTKPAAAAVTATEVARKRQRAVHVLCWNGKTCMQCKRLLLSHGMHRNHHAAPKSAAVSCKDMLLLAWRAKTHPRLMCGALLRAGMPCHATHNPSRFTHSCPQGRRCISTTAGLLLPSLQPPNNPTSWPQVHWCCCPAATPPPPLLLPPALPLAAGSADAPAAAAAAAVREPPAA